MMKLRIALLCSFLCLLAVIPVSAQIPMGTTITIEGEVTEIISSYAFVMVRTEPFDFTPSRVVIFNDDTQPFAIDVNVGNTVQVTGSVNNLVLSDISTAVGYQIDPALFSAYTEADYAIIAAAVFDELTIEPDGDIAYDFDASATLEADPSIYLEQTVTVEGYVAEILDPYSFRMVRTRPFNLSPASLIVISDDNDPFEIDINTGRHVRVTGPFYIFNPQSLNDRVEYFLNPEYFMPYDEDDYAIIAETTEATGLRPLDTVTPDNTIEIDPATARFVEMDAIEDSPLAFVGQTVIIDGEMENIYTPNTFLFEEEEFFDFFPLQIPVFTTQDVVYPDTAIDSLDLEIDAIYTLVGEIVAFNLFDIENRIGYASDAELYTDFDDTNIAIIVTEIRVGRYR